MTVTAQFQGVVTVPLYITPYTFVPPNGATSVGMLGGVSSQPLVVKTALTYSQQIQSQLGTTSAGVTGSMLTSGWSTLLTIQNAYSLILNGPSSGGGIRTFGTPIMYQNNLVNAEVQIYNNNAWANYASAPFYANKTIAGIYSPGNSINELNTPVVSSTNLNLGGDARPSLTNINLTFGGIKLGNFEGFTIPFTPDAGNMWLCTFLGLQKQAWCLNTGISGSNFYAKFVTMPAPEINSNWLWTEKTLGGYSIGSYTSSFELTTGNWTNVMGTLDTWQTDNAALNTLINGSGTHVTAFNYGSVMISTNDGKDYIVSKDGLRYWQLVLTCNVNAFYLNTQRTIPGNFSDSGGSRLTTTRWIDKAGILWYVGGPNQANISGNWTVQPAFSLALNLFPPPGLYLPQIPPISGNCWSTCLDRIGGRPGNINPTGQAN